MSWYSRGAAALVLTLALLGTGSVVRAQDTSLAGDILTGLLPVTAFGIAYFKGDTEGEKQWARNVAANQFLATAARVGFNETSWGTRPGGGSYGFPSGHVAFIASGAAFLQERYGWMYGVPAWAVTGYVAFNRVDNNHHRWRDVVASSVLAYGVGKLFVTPEIATHLAPVIGPDFMGLRWSRSF
jgi:membrane-associated phospholipid phosphatase